MISQGAPTAVKGFETKAWGLSQRRVRAGLMRVELRMLRPILVRSLVELNIPPALLCVSEAVHQKGKGEKWLTEFHLR